MAGDAFRRVQAGDTADGVPAEAWNAMTDLVLRARRQQQQRLPGAAVDLPDRCQVWVQNNSGSDLDQFGVLGVSGSLIDPADNADRFAQRVALTGVKPAAEHVDGKFVVLPAPLASGSVGAAVAAGVTVCKLNVTDETHKFAKAKADTTAALASADSGVCQVLWKQSGTGDGKWAVVRFGGGSAPGVKWGKLTALWSPGQNFVTLQPVKDSAGTAFSSPVPATITAWIISPINKKPAYLLGEVNDVFPYEDKGAGAVFLVNPQTTPIPVKQFEVIQNQGTSPTAPQWVADVMRGHNIP